MAAARMRRKSRSTGRPLGPVEALAYCLGSVVVK
jgi:hypothetical protein